MDLFSFVFGFVSAVALAGVAIFIVALSVTVKKMRSLEAPKKK